MQLEVSFALELEGGGKAKFVVIEVGANTTASQLHRVTMKLVPLHVTVEPAGAETIDKVQEAAPGLGDAAGGAATQAEKPTGPGESLCGGGRGGGGGRVRGRFSKRGPLYRQ